MNETCWVNGDMFPFFRQDFQNMLPSVVTPTWGPLLTWSDLVPFLDFLHTALHLNNSRGMFLTMKMLLNQFYCHYSCSCVPICFKEKIRFGARFFLGRAAIRKQITHYILLIFGTSRWPTWGKKCRCCNNSWDDFHVSNKGSTKCKQSYTLAYTKKDNSAWI